LSPIAKASATNLRLLHPDWEFLFFDDEAIRRFIKTEYPQYTEVFDGFAKPIQRIDFFRYLAVSRFGGFYFDLDVFLSASLSGLLSHGCVFPFEELTLSRFLRREYKIDWELGNYGFGAAAGDPFLDAIVQNCIRAHRDRPWLGLMLRDVPAMFRSDFEVLCSTGPGLVTRTYASEPRMAEHVTVLFPPNVCDSANWHLFGSYGIHYMDGSWRDKGGFLHRKLAGWWEVRMRTKLLAESLGLGPKRLGR
jgi:mannosyltransferase OCH1-like enzyme